MDEYDIPSGDEFDRRARSAGEALRRPAPAGGLERVHRTRRRRRLAQGAAVVGAFAVIVVLGAVVLRSGGDSLSVAEPGSSTTETPTTPSVGTAASSTSDPSGAPAAPATEPPVPSSSIPTPTTTPAGGPPTPTSSAVGAAAACLVGEWSLPSEQLSTHFDHVAANLDWTEVDVTGGVRMSFDAGTFRVDQEFSLTYVESGGPNSFPPRTVTVDVIATSAGSWAAGGDRIAVTGERFVGDPTFSFAVDGQPVGPDDAGDRFVDVLPRSWVDGASFECSGPTIAIGNPVEAEWTQPPQLALAPV